MVSIEITYQILSLYVLVLGGMMKMKAKNYGAFWTIVFLGAIGLFYIYVSLMSDDARFSEGLYFPFLLGVVFLFGAIYVLLNYSKEDNIEPIKGKVKEK